MNPHHSRLTRDARPFHGPDVPTPTIPFDGLRAQSEDHRLSASWAEGHRITNASPPLTGIGSRRRMLPIKEKKQTPTRYAVTRGRLIPLEIVPGGGTAWGPPASGDPFLRRPAVPYPLKATDRSNAAYKWLAYHPQIGIGAGYSLGCHETCRYRHSSVGHHHIRRYAPKACP